MTSQRGLGRREMLRIRSNPGERQAFTEAAALVGVSLSAWARMVMRAAAIKTLTDVPQKAGVLEGLIGK